jgi:hypothetical protein
VILSDRVVRRPGGGGGGVTQWSPLAFTPAALIDTGSLTKAGTGFDASTGRLTVVYNTHVAAVDGYQDALARYTVPLLTAFPSFDISRHVLDLGLDCPSFVHGTVEAGLFVGLYDSTTVDASLQGAGVTIWQSTAATDRCARQGTTNHSSLASPGLLDGVALTLSFDSTGDGSVVPAIANVHALLESGRWVAVQTQMAESLRGTPSSWVIGFGASHLSTDDCNNATQVADIVYRVREVSRPFG